MSEEHTSDDAYAEMLREHVRLRTLLEELKQVFAERAVTMSDISDRLVLLRSLIEQHFRTEEASGCFGELVSQAPHVADRVDALIAEHDTLAGEIDQLVASASQGKGDREHWDALSRDFDHFHARLTRHEHVENELLQAVFSEDIGSKD